MRHILILFVAANVMVLCSSSAWAAGWNDYALPIDPGFEIVRANNLEINLARTNGQLIYSNGNYPYVGQVALSTPTVLPPRATVSLQADSALRLGVQDNEL